MTDALVVAKLDRLAPNLRDFQDIIDELTVKNMKLRIGGFVHDPSDPVGPLLFNVLPVVEESESDLIRAHARECMQVAKAKVRLRVGHSVWRGGLHLFGMAWRDNAHLT